MLALVVQTHPNRTGPDFRREFVRRLACHGSHLLKSWSLRQSRGGSLMKLLGSDAVHNISRVMRLGGTISRPTQDKRDRGYVDEMVTLHVHKNAPAYRIDDL